MLDNVVKRKRENAAEDIEGTFTFTFIGREPVLVKKRSVFMTFVMDNVLSILVRFVLPYRLDAYICDGTTFPDK